MAHNTSSKEKTVLWIIVPIAVGLTLLFTWRNGQVPPPKTPAAASAAVTTAPAPQH